MPADQISLAIRDHQIRLSDWDYSDIAGELHRWVGLIDSEFKLQLPSYPILKFAPIRNAYATYAWFCGELGMRDTITFNTHELARDPALIIRTLTHELLHLWQNYFGKPSRGNGYHNTEFRKKAAECGLLVTEQGCTTGHTDVFVAVLARHGICMQPLPVEARVYGSKGSSRGQRLKRWRCRCTELWCGGPLDAACGKCLGRFSPAVGKSPNPGNSTEEVAFDD